MGRKRSNYFFSSLLPVLFLPLASHSRVSGAIDKVELIHRLSQKQNQKKLAQQAKGQKTELGSSLKARQESDAEKMRLKQESRWISIAKEAELILFGSHRLLHWPRRKRKLLQALQSRSIPPDCTSSFT